MKKAFAIVALLLTTNLLAQETNNGKKMWAKSFLNKDAPELIVARWASDKPDVKGKFVLVDFWATWCGPCRATIPRLNAVSQKYADRLVVIGISDEPMAKVRAMKGPEIKYFSAIDPTRTMYKQLYISGIPHCILISPQGKVIWEGFPLLSGYQLTNKVIEGLLDKYSAIPAQ